MRGLRSRKRCAWRWGAEAPKAKPNGGALARAGAAEPEAMRVAVGAEAPKAKPNGGTLARAGGCGAGSDARVAVGG